MDLRIDLQGKALPLLAKPLGYRGVEPVSSPFSIDVGITTPATLDLDVSGFVDEMLVVETSVDGGAPERFTGVVAEAEIAHVAGGEALVRLTLVPRLYRLGHAVHSRVFVDKTIPEVVAEVLALEGFTAGDFRFELAETYARREHVSQYRESSLAFVQRLLEREGIHYAFDHEPDKDVVVFRDRPNGPAARAPFTYGSEAQLTSLAIGEPLIVGLRARRVALPREVVVNDHAPYGAASDVTGRSAVLPELTPRIVRWAPNEETRDGAGRRARVLGESLRAREEVFEGTSTSPSMRAGSRFTLADHPRAQLIQEYFVTRVHHEVIAAAASAEQRALLGFSKVSSHFTSTRFEAIPASAPFRPPVSTPVPRVEGLVDAVVDGPVDSQYAQVDEHGRYHVRVRFDEMAAKSGGASMWVRMLQPHGGSLEGMHFPLRKGTEVHLTFLGGDPDRPVIAGVAPNAEKPSPVTQANASKNVVQTGGLNRLEIEDARGGQYLNMRTPTAASHLHMGAGPYQLALRTTGQGHLLTGNSLEVEVLGPKTEKVASNVTETYCATQTLDVLGEFVETLASTLSTTVGGPVISTIVGELVETITSAVAETYMSGLSTCVCGGLTTLKYDAGLEHHVTGAVTVKFDAGQETKVKGTLDLTVGGSMTETFDTTKRHIKGTYDVTVDSTYDLTCPTHVLKVPKVGLNFSTLYRLSPFQLDFPSDHTEAKGAIFKIGGKKSSTVGVSLFGVGAALTICGLLNQNGNTRLKVPTGFKKEEQLLKLTIHGIALQLGPQVKT